MARFRLRKMTVILDEIHHDGGPDASHPRQRGAVLAVVSNPFAGRYEADLQPGEALAIRVIDGRRGRMAAEVEGWEAANGLVSVPGDGSGPDEA